jgi:hypothetical protein
MLRALCGTWPQSCSLLDLRGAGDSVISEHKEPRCRDLHPLAL